MRGSDFSTVWAGHDNAIAEKTNAKGRTRMFAVQRPAKHHNRLPAKVSRQTEKYFLKAPAAASSKRAAILRLDADGCRAPAECLFRRKEATLDLPDQEFRTGVRQMHNIGRYHVLSRRTDPRQAAFAVAEHAPGRDVFDPVGLAERPHLFVASRP